MRSIKILILAFVIVGMAGCATYRTDSDTQFESTDVGASENYDIQLLTGDLTEKTYTELGPIEAIVKKLTVFHKNPTQEQVDFVLREKAAKMEADAVINIEYKSGVGATTWGYMKATGTAVKITE